MIPPFTITAEILKLISNIERLIGRVESLDQPQPQLRKSNRVKTLQGSLAIEGNSLDLEQITASRDLKTGADTKLLMKSGEKPLTLYKFK